METHFDTVKDVNGDLSLSKLEAVVDKLTDEVNLSKLVTVFAGTFTWSGSGASKAQTITGALATDIVVASVKTSATEASYLKSAILTTDTLTVVLSAANTSNDAVISYIIQRASA